MRILVVEDDTDINNMIAAFLEARGCRVLQAFSGTEGRMLWELQGCDLAVMDLMLPGLSGEALLSCIRQKSRLPVIILTAKSALEDKVELLAGGADDYLTKPFALEELWARIQVQLRHRSRDKDLQESDKRLCYGEWELDCSQRRLTASGKPVELTGHELGIVELLMGRPRKVFTRQEIYESVWGQEAFIEDKTINVHISNIRAKLRAAQARDYIETVWGIGFKLSDKHLNNS